MDTKMVKLTSFERERVQQVADKMFKFMDKVNNICRKGLRKLFQKDI